MASKINEGSVFSILLYYPVQNNLIEEVESPSVFVSKKVKPIVPAEPASIAPVVQEPEVIVPPPPKGTRPRKLARLSRSGTESSSKNGPQSTLLGSWSCCQSAQVRIASASSMSFASMRVPVRDSTNARASGLDLPLSKLNTEATLRKFWTPS